MMQMTFYKRLFFFVVVSTMIAMVNLVIAAVYSFYVPVVVAVSDETNLSMASDKKQIYTLEQLVEAERKMDERIRLRKEKDNNITLKELLQEERKHAIYVCWLPWILVPFLLKINHWLLGLALLSVPVILVLAGLFLPVEILIFGGCLYLGSQFKRRIFSTG